jgi:hypothetical protein
MQGPTNEASIPTENVINGPNLNHAFTVRRKAAKRSDSWYSSQSIAAPLPRPREDEDLPPAKRRRLQARTSISTPADGAVHAHTAETVTTDSPDDTPTDSVTPAALLPSAAASRAPRRIWTPEEDTKLKDAVEKHGKDWWVAVAMLVPGRTNVQCREHWFQSLDPAKGKKGKWIPEEDAKLTKVVKKHGRKWVKVAPMVPDRTGNRCRKRWARNWIKTAPRTVEEEHNGCNDEVFDSVPV